MTDAERVKELIREQLYRFLHREVPFLTRQETRLWEVQPDGSLHIDHDIQVRSVCLCLTWVGHSYRCLSDPTSGNGSTG